MYFHEMTNKISNQGQNTSDLITKDYLNESEMNSWSTLSLDIGVICSVFCSKDWNIQR